MTRITTLNQIEDKIYLIRGQKVMLDYDLAGLYEIEAKQLKRQVRRNIIRFPYDFMFQLTKQEYLRCQIGTSSYGGRRRLPFAFTEQGIAMLSSVLNSEKAIQVNIAIIRTFVKLKQLLLNNKEMEIKLNKLEKTVLNHDTEITVIFKVLRKMLITENKPKKKIGFDVGGQN